MHTATKTPAHSGSLLDAARELGNHPQRLRSLRSRLLTVLVACLTGLGAWIVYLAISMPTGYRSKAWSAAWVGFDILLLLSLTGTIVAAMLRRQIVVMLAVFTATLLLCDAWFDIVLDWGTSDVWVSLASAAFAEVPLALFLLHRARKLVRVAIQRRWHELGLPGEPPALHRIPLFYAVEATVPTVSDTAVPDIAGPEVAVSE
ncbi:hypothetical protein KGQ20_12515 [Catenulispora sp. NF23]|uniref:Uncharacterized protein n=1 Tax=Catenulispora pinistramenti TaxID=2705254 RepID=A0ABS5KKL3_9ACTN|nr:hypothetical protein [Catenulispora pinistramenti]MBS2533593.1 hypothetical protein [Catenulispora pinistramenti]MBS2546486.1 hypothetical protein [Catenulispora pinistramenti]